MWCYHSLSCLKKCCKLIGFRHFLTKHYKLIFLSLIVFDEKSCVRNCVKNELIQLEIKSTKCYSINIKGATAHKVVSLPVWLKAYLYRLSNKVGLFIFACCSYLYRQAVQSGSYRQKTKGSKSRMYSSHHLPS